MVNISIGEYPSSGHMAVVSNWDGVCWVADRHAVVRRGAVELEGPSRRMLEAPAGADGVVTFDGVREHNAHERNHPAAGKLFDPRRIEEALYPPYIPDAKERSSRPYLNPPVGLLWQDAVVLDPDRRLIYWLRHDIAFPEDSGVWAAPVCGHGPILWGQTRASTAHPTWVRTVLLDHAYGPLSDER